MRGTLLGAESILGAAVLGVLLMYGVRHALRPRTPAGVDTQSELRLKEGHAPDVALGELLLDRLIEDKWIHRRVDRIFFEGEQRIRRHVSFDMEIPQALTQAHADAEFTRNWAIVPLTYLEKRDDPADQKVLRGVDGRDESGSSLSILGHYDNALAAWGVLTAATLRVTGEQALPETDQRTLWEVVACPRLVAIAKVELLRSERAAHVVAGLAPESLVLQAMAQPAYANLLSRLAKDYLVLADLAEQLQSRRRILKFSYDEQLRPSPRPRDANSDEGPAKPNRLRMVLASLGLVSPVLVLRLNSLVPVRSFHAEVHAPVGTDFLDAVLLAKTRFAKRQGRLDARIAEAQTLRARDVHISSHRSIAHLHMSNLPPNVRFVLGVTLRLRGGAVAWVALLASFLLTTMLAVSLTWPEQVLADQDAARSILLVLPGLVAGSAALHPAHAIVSRYRLGIHLSIVAMLVIAFVALLNVVAALPLSLDRTVAVQDLVTWSQQAEHVWTVLLLASCAVNSLLLANVLPFPRPRPPRQSKRRH